MFWSPEVGLGRQNAILLQNYEVSQKTSIVGDMFFCDSAMLAIFFETTVNFGRPLLGLTPSTPLWHTYSESFGHEDSPGNIQNIPYL